MKAKLEIHELTPEYMRQEYGLTRKEWEAAKRRITREIAAERKAGRLQGIEALAVKPKTEVLHLNLHREFFAAIVAKSKRIEYRERTAYWKTRLESRRYDVICFRNGYASNAPEMLVEWRGVRKLGTTRGGRYAIRLGRILKIKRWRG